MNSTELSDEIPKIFDDEHGKLLSRIRELCCKLTETARDHEIIFTISEIHAAAEAHFKQEEEIMRRHHDSNYSKHKVDHDRLLEEISSLMEEVGAGLMKAPGSALAARCEARLAAHHETHDRNFLTGAGFPAGTHRPEKAVRTAEN